MPARERSLPDDAEAIDHIARKPLHHTAGEPHPQHPPSSHRTAAGSRDSGVVVVRVSLPPCDEA